MCFARVVASVLCAGMAILGGNLARAQTFPSKPVRIVLSAAGSASDIVARMMAPALGAGLGQAVIVDNRPGQLGIQAVRTAAPDGYTLLIYGAGLWVVPLMDDKVQYDPVKDFLPVTMLNRAPNVLVVHPSLPVKSVKDLIALAKSKPDQMNVASGSPGSTSQLAAEMFNSLARVKITRIPYAGGPPAVNALVGGQVQLMFAIPSTVQGQINTGRLRPIAVTGAESSPLVPGLPPIATSLPGYEIEAIIAMYAPAGTPSPIIARVNQEIARALNQPEIRDKQFNAGMLVATGSPEQLAAFMKADIARMSKLVKEAGLREQ